MSAKLQRLRVTFTRGEEMKYITHLDLMRFWERALRRAELPVSYSEGFTPHAQIALAAPLPVGTTSDCELMDVFLSERMAPPAFIEQAKTQLPAGVTLAGAEEIGIALPSVQAEVRFAEYEVAVPGATEAQATSAVGAFLESASVPWEHKRDKETRTYDLRPLVAEIAVSRADGGVDLWMRLRSDNAGAGRPEQVVAALGLPAPRRIHRTKLVLAGTSPSREAWRKRGRFAS